MTAQNIIIMGYLALRVQLDKLESAIMTNVWDSILTRFKTTTETLQTRDITEHFLFSTMLDQDGRNTMLFSPMRAIIIKYII